MPRLERRPRVDSLVRNRAGDRLQEQRIDLLSDALAYPALRCELRLAELRLAELAHGKRIGKLMRLLQLLRILRIRESCDLLRQNRIELRILDNGSDIRILQSRVDQRVLQKRVLQYRILQERILLHLLEWILLEQILLEWILLQWILQPGILPQPRELRLQGIDAGIAGLHELLYGAGIG